jgi:hypothetical protein
MLETREGYSRYSGNFIIIVDEGQQRKEVHPSSAPLGFLRAIESIYVC